MARVIETVNSSCFWDPNGTGVILFLAIVSQPFEFSCFGDPNKLGIAQPFDSCLLEDTHKCGWSDIVGSRVYALGNPGRQKHSNLTALGIPTWLSHLSPFCVGAMPFVSSLLSAPCSENPIGEGLTSPYYSSRFGNTNVVEALFDSHNPHMAGEPKKESDTDSDSDRDRSCHASCPRLNLSSHISSSCNGSLCIGLLLVMCMSPCFL